MARNFLKLAGGCVFLSQVVLYAYVLKNAPSGLIAISASAAFILGSFSLFYAYVRLFAFKRKLTRFLRRLLSGNYETGIKVSELLHDEVRQLEQLADKVAEQLRVYDRLRSEKVALNFRMLELLFRSGTTKAIIADVAKNIFQFNPAARAFFGTEQEEISFDALEKNENNAKFSGLFRDAVEHQKIIQEGTVTLMLPSGNVQKKTSIKIIPVKNKEERVDAALIFLEQEDQEAPF